MPIDTMIDTNPGIIHIAGRRKPVTEASHHNYGVLSFSDVIVRSSNVGAIKIGLRVGTERLSKYVGAVRVRPPGVAGFSRREPGHRVEPVEDGPRARWRRCRWAIRSASHRSRWSRRSAPSPTAASYIEPRVIRAIYKDNRRYAVQPKVVRRAISADTAATLVGIMEGVVGDPHGTAKAAQIPGYTIAGKTGTAAKLVNGHYSTTDYNASFVGFIPSRNPAIAIIVVTDTPHAGFTTGGSVSAPVFKRIAEASLQYLGVGPSVNPQSPVLVARQDESANAPTTTVSAIDPTVSVVADGPPGTVPDVRGMSARDAVRKLVTLGMTARVSGDGFVVSQTPPAGAPIEGEALCRLVLERWPSTHVVTASRP